MRGALPLLIAALVASVGCRNDMYDQPRYKPLSAGSPLLGPSSALQLPEGTVAREQGRSIGVFDTGMREGELTQDIPFPVKLDVLRRGRERYTIFCAPCHGSIGDGEGMIVKRGFPHPPSFHTDELRNAPIGHFFDVITHGHGAMYSYAARIEPGDRWNICAYIRALQLSQHADVRALSESDRKSLGEAPK